MRAVLLLSGGLDSSVCLALANEEGRSVYALSFNYGQTHSTELDAAAAVVASVGAEDHKIVSLPLLGKSALTGDGPIEQGADWRRAGVPSTYVPARNLTFLSIAWGYAETLGAEEVWIGANVVDYSGYPDCRPEFLDAFQLAAASGTNASISLRAPLLRMAKSKIVAEALRLGLDIESTMSCYLGTNCGTCDSCQIRAEALELT